MHLNVGQAIPFIGIFSADIFVHMDKDIYARMLIATLSIYQKLGNVLKTHS